MEPGFPGCMASMSSVPQCSYLFNGKNELLGTTEHQSMSQKTDDGMCTVGEGQWQRESPGALGMQKLDSNLEGWSLGGCRKGGCGS